VKLLVFLMTAVLAGAESQTVVQSPAEVAAPAQLSPETASALVVKRVPAVYSEKARSNGIQGTVVVKILITETGNVKEATVVSGDPDLAQAAVDAIKQWQYKPYAVDGKAMQAQTQVSFDFHIRPPGPRNMPGTFKDGMYQNQFFGLTYRLSSQWFRATPPLSNHAPSDVGEEIRLAASHAPVAPDGWGTPSTFVLGATLPSPGRNDAKQELAALTATLSAEKKVSQDGDIGQFETAGLTFYRADFQVSNDQYQTIVCTLANGHLFHWNFLAVSKSAMKEAVATLSSITQVEMAPANPSTTPEGTTPKTPTAISRVRVSSGVLFGLIQKKVEPEYPQDAKDLHIQGTVVLHVIVDDQGNVTSIGLVAGPGMLAPSAIDAVSRWRYKPYMLNGKPIELDSTVEVRFTLGG
jgi:TonB family protein